MGATWMRRKPHNILSHNDVLTRNQTTAKPQNGNPEKESRHVKVTVRLVMAKKSHQRTKVR